MSLEASNCYDGFNIAVISAKKPVFDLKASLAKPLGYTPHRGKLKPFSLAHVDVKQATKAKIRSVEVKHFKSYSLHLQSLLFFVLGSGFLACFLRL